MATLKRVPAQDSPELLAEPVRPKISGGMEVAEIDPEVADTAEFCATYDWPPEQCANCVIVEARREGRRWFAACVILAHTRADVNKLVKKHLGASKISFAPMDKAVAESGMEYGGITPIGLPADWPVLIDPAVAAADEVVIGSGLRKSKIFLPGKTLVTATNGEVLPGLGMVSHD